MFTPHPDLQVPPDETAIWRYIELDRLLGVLCTSKLHLSRLDHLGDPWEGTWPQPLLDKWKSASSKTSFLLNTDQLQKMMFVSCWHVSPHESAALWAQYSGRSGFAIKSTVGRIKSALIDERRFHIGSVQYKDFEIDREVTFGTMNLPLLKRKSFEHEKELRVVLFDPKSVGDHTRESDELACDISKLIEEIFLSPQSSDWMQPNVRLLLEKFDLGGIRLTRSTLFDKRVY